MSSTSAMCFIVGRLGKKYDVKTTRSNVSVSTISVVANSNPRNREDVTWFTVTLWGQAAIFVDSYVEVGDVVSLAGNIFNESYDDANGNKASKLKINAYEINLVSKKKSNGDSSIEDNDDIPF